MKVLWEIYSIVVDLPESCIDLILNGKLTDRTMLLQTESRNNYTRTPVARFKPGKYLLSCIVK